MLVSLEGPNSTGKTTFAYTAPRPIVGFAFDLGWKRAIYGAKHDELFSGLSIKVHEYDLSVVDPPKVENDITIYELPAPVQLDQIRMKGVRDQWSYFIIRFGAAVTNPEVRSLVVDTMSSARRIKADAFLESLQDNTKPGEKMRERLIQIEYGNPNDAIRDLYSTSQGTHKNLVATHHLQDERKDGIDKDGRIVQGMLTGNKVLEGLAKTHDLVDIALRMEEQKGQIKAQFLKCGYNLALKNTGLDNPTWNTLVGQIESFTGDRLGLERA